MRALFTGLLIYCLSATAWANIPSPVELRTLFPKLTAEQASQLHEEGHIFRYYYKNEAAKFEPQLSDAEVSLFSVERASPNSNLSAEAIYYIPLPSLSTQTDENPEQARMLSIYNTLRSISTLGGIEYFSESRKKMRTLFKTAYVVSDAKSKNRVPDPLVEQIPRASTLTVFQHDSTFGKNLSSASYHYSGDKIGLTIQNLTTLRYALFPFIKKGNMQTRLIVIPSRHGILIYGNVSAKTLRFLGLEKKKQASFYNRLNALFSWLNLQLQTKSLATPREGEPEPPPNTLSM